MSSVLAQPSDMISNLPDNVIKTILMYLPTRDAVRTSYLARRWRYRWTKLPQLIIDETLCNKSRVTFAMILCQLLLPHEGPINKFSLSIPGLENFPEIDNLILFLSRNGIEDLTLKMRTDGWYRLPSSIFTCQRLRHLSLRSCLIDTTPAFKGFNRLATLELCDVAITGKMLTSLISNLPVLELLELDISSDYLDIEIEAPNLKTFRFRGLMRSIFFKKAPLLSSVSIVPDGLKLIRTNFKEVRTRNFVEFFHGLPVLENLHLNYVLIQPLSTAGAVPRKLLTTLVYLRDLELIGLKLYEMHEALFILCLIRSSPNLKHLCIYFSFNTTFNPKASLEFLKEEDYSDIILNELKEVKLQGLTGARPELELVKLLLAKSPSLKKMLIHPSSSIAADEGYEILKKLTEFQRASKEAQVVYADGEENQV